MKDSSDPMDSDEEFESLFRSFGKTRSAPEETPPNRQDQMRERLGRVKARRDAARKAEQAESVESAGQKVEQESPVEDLESLDLEATRRELLQDAETAEHQTEKQKASKDTDQKRILGLKPMQLGIVVVLGLLIIVIYGAVGVIIWRTLPGSEVPLPAETEEILPVFTENPSTVEGGTSNTPEATETSEPTVAPTPENRPTPTPAIEAPVSTRYDLQILQSPNDVELRIERGGEYLRLRAYEAALRDFKHAQELDGERAEVYVGLGRAYFFLRRWDEAEAALGTAISFNEDLAPAHFWLGQVLYHSGRYEEASQEFDWAAEINPEEPTYESWLARAAAEMGDVEEALGAAERALNLDEELPLAYVARAEVRVLEDDIEAAHGDLLHAQGIAPHNFYVLNTLARFYAEYVPERIVEAEWLAQQAQEWASWQIQEAQALHTLGRIYLKQGHVAAAQRALTEASDLATVDGKVILPGLREDFDRTLAP